MNRKTAQRLYEQGIKIEVMDNRNWLELSDGIKPKEFKKSKKFRIKKHS